MGPQGHEAHPCSPERVLGVKEKVEHLTPIVSVFWPYFPIRGARPRRKCSSFTRISVSESKCNTAGMQRRTLGQNVITMWVHHLHQGCGSLSFLEGNADTHIPTHTPTQQRFSLSSGHTKTCLSLHSSSLRGTALLTFNQANQLPLMSARFNTH